MQQASKTENNLPKVSIVTVTFNAGPLLEKTLGNLQMQDYPNKEIVVVDGKSTDDTIITIKRYAHSGTITTWVSEPDRGIYDAMNKGVGMATGEWVIFMNAGDVFAADDVLRCVFCQPLADADVVYGDVVKDGNVKKAPESYYLYHRMIFCHQCVFTRRDSLISTPFDIKHRLSADFKSFIELYQKGARFRYVNLPIAIFDTGGVSNSHRSKGLRDNISVVWETIPMPQRLKFIMRLGVPYLMCRLRGK